MDIQEQNGKVNVNSMLFNKVFLPSSDMKLDLNVSSYGGEGNMLVILRTSTFCKQKKFGGYMFSSNFLHTRYATSSGTLPRNLDGVL